jgi:flagellar hook-associated protein 3
MELYYKINEQASSEKRINKPSDDPLGLSVSTGLKADKASYTQYKSNITEAKSYLQGADDALGKLQDLIIKVREFAETNASETSTPIEMDIAEEQIDQFLEEAINIANTKVNNKYIFSGYKTDVPAYDTSSRIIEPYASSDNTYNKTVTAEGEYNGTENKTYLIKFTSDGSVGDISDPNTAKFAFSSDGGETWSTEESLTNLKVNVKNSDGTDSGIDLNFEDGDFKTGDLFRVQVGKGNYQGDEGSIQFNTNINSRITTNLNGNEIFEDSGFFDSIYKLKNALQSRNFNEISDTVKELDDLHTNIQSKVALTGINLSRVEIAESNITSLQENVTENIQGIEKADLVDLLTQFTMVESALNSSMTALSKVFPKSLLNMI